MCSADCRADLERVRDWACGVLASGVEPRWVWYQHMKLVEAIEGILAGADGPVGGVRLVLVDDGCERDAVSGLPVRWGG